MSRHEKNILFNIEVKQEMMAKIQFEMSLNGF